MNERIRQLAEQAEQYANEQNDKYGVRFKTEYDNKFADLLIKQCGQWIVDNAGAMEHLGPKYFVQAMIKDFGVEE